MKEKVVLAYSGGLDTTTLIPWLKENFNYDVICCCVNCGQGNELDGLDERAKLSGASKLYIEDIIDDFCDNYIMPCVEAGAVYEHKYLLGTSMARPAIAKKLVEIARKEGATAICHGATGKGNDQIRFELGIKALALACLPMLIHSKAIRSSRIIMIQHPRKPSSSPATAKIKSVWDSEMKFPFFTDETTLLSRPFP